MAHSFTCKQHHATATTECIANYVSLSSVAVIWWRRRRIIIRHEGQRACRLIWVTVVYARRLYFWTIVYIRWATVRSLLGTNTVWLFARIRHSAALLCDGFNVRCLLVAGPAPDTENALGLREFPTRVGRSRVKQIRLVASAAGARDERRELLLNCCRLAGRRRWWWWWRWWRRGCWGWRQWCRFVRRREQRPRDNWLAPRLLTIVIR